MTEDLQLRGYADRTVEAYVRAVAQLARFHGRPPDQLTEDQVREYFLHLGTVRKVARGTLTIALCGIKFFYAQTLGRQWRVLGLARPLSAVVGHTKAVVEILQNQRGDVRILPENLVHAFQLSGMAVIHHLTCERWLFSEELAHSRRSFVRVKVLQSATVNLHSADKVPSSDAQLFLVLQRLRVSGRTLG